jgi:hypothetical protein
VVEKVEGLRVFEGVEWLRVLRWLRVENVEG